MQEVAVSTINDRIGFDTDIRAACVPGAIDSARRTALRDANLTVLLAVAGFSDRYADGDEDAGRSRELATLDAKVNALLMMVSQLMQQQMVLPPAFHVSFTAVGARLPKTLWSSEVAHGVLELHFDESLGMPLRLPAKLIAERDADHVWVEFEGLGEAVSEALDRMVFRYHRRQVAEMRQSTP